MKMHLRRRELLAAVLLSAVIPACSDNPPAGTELYPLTGVITQNDKPVPGGGILFVPETEGMGGRVIDAPVGPDGTFAARTSKLSDVPVKFYPGAPVGTYKLIYHPANNGATTGMQIEPDVRVTVEAKANTVAIVLPPRPSPRSGKACNGTTTPRTHRRSRRQTRGNKQAGRPTLGASRCHRPP
jgi:hypothetical protein